MQGETQLAEFITLTGTQTIDGVVLNAGDRIFLTNPTTTSANKKKIGKEDFATILNGREYGNEMSIDEEFIARDNELLVCFCSSDDLLIFKGIFNDETGSTAYIMSDIKTGGIKLAEDDATQRLEEIREFTGFRLNLQRIKMVRQWYIDGTEGFCIKTTLPHATFDIMEDGELYCRGIVIEKADIETALGKIV